MSDAEKYERGLRALALLRRIEQAALEDQDLENFEEPEKKGAKVVRTRTGFVWR